jgi:hypothetical protein
MVDRSGRLEACYGPLSLSSFLSLLFVSFPTSSSRLWELCGILGGWRAGAQDFQGVWEGPEGGRVAARSFPYPVSFHSRGGGSRGGGGAGRAARAPHDGLSSGVPSVVLRLDSPRSLIW